MKAQDYVDKWYDKLVNANGKESEILTSLFIDLWNEVNLLSKQRNIKFLHAQLAIIKEINQKYNKFCRLVNKKVGGQFLIEDGFKKHVIMSNPVLEGKL
jgi:hypothetical protein